MDICVIVFIKECVDLHENNGRTRRMFNDRALTKDMQIKDMCSIVRDYW